MGGCLSVCLWEGGEEGPKGLHWDRKGRVGAVCVCVCVSVSLCRCFCEERGGDVMHEIGPPGLDMLRSVSVCVCACDT